MDELDWRDRLQELALEVAAILAQRGEVYGDPRESFMRHAEIFEGVLHRTVTPAEAAMLLAGLKLSRLGFEPTHRDSWLDLAAYALIGALLAEDAEACTHLGL